jgi:predicted DNA-binding transcriptional regulator YafY
MSKKQFIKRHHLVINKLRCNPCSFKELQKHLENHSIDADENYMISKRTFERDVNEIRDIYKIDIEYNRSMNCYEIVHDADEVKNDRLMESFQIFNALSVSESISNQIILENRQPLGTENMHGLLHAIKNHFEVHFTHEKYWDEDHEKTRRRVQPLALKEAKNRWYLIARDANDNRVKPFGLDRITDVDITRKKFNYPTGYNPEEVYNHSFGIITEENNPPQKIILSYSYDQGKYIKSLPLHHSQKELINDEKEYRIELFLQPTYDFLMELLSVGKEVKVIEPLSLQKEIIKMLEGTLERYK